MQNFCIDSPRMRKEAAVAREVMKEKASGLGITGRRLQASLTEYLCHRQAGSTAPGSRELLARISRDLEDLLIQRESIGLPHENLEWVLRSYSIPTEVLARLGLHNAPP